MIRRIVSRILNADAMEDSETLEKFLTPIKHKPDRNRVLFPDEKSMLVSRLIYASEHRFGRNIGQGREAMDEITNDIHPTC